MMNSRLQLSASLVLFLLVRAGSAEDFNPRAMLEDAAKQPDRIVCRKLWTSKQAVRLFQGLSISKDGKLVGASTNDDRCIVFDGDSGEVVMQASKVEGLLKDQGSLITSTSLSADGSRIAIAQYSGELAVLNTSNFDEVRRFPRTNKSIHAMHLTPDGKTLSWVDREGTFSRSELAAAETQSQKFNWNFQGKLLELFSFSDSGRLLAYRAGPHAKEIYLMHLAAAPEEPQQPTIHSEEAAICLALAPESLAYVTNQGVRYVHKLPLGDVNKPPEKPLLRQVIFVSPNAQESRFMAYSSDGKLSFILGRGQVEIHGQDWTYLSILVDADFDFAAQACWATDAKRFAIVDPQGYASLYEIQGEIDHPGWAFRRKLDQHS